MGNDFFFHHHIVLRKGLSIGPSNSSARNKGGLGLHMMENWNSLPYSPKEVWVFFRRLTPAGRSAYAHSLETMVKIMKARAEASLLGVCSTVNAK